jgi:hypothetical protein
MPGLVGVGKAPHGVEFLAVLGDLMGAGRVI